jgi:hypothetical protein
LKKILKWVLAPVAVIWFLGWAYIQINYPTCTFRYKLTAEVNTPEGVKTGSSVIEVSYSHNGDWGGGETPNLNLSGEAVYVDLGAGKNLFVTLTNRESGREYSSPAGLHGMNFGNEEGAMDAFMLPLRTFGLAYHFGEERKLCREISEISSLEAKTAPIENLPTLVTFRSLSDPNSIAVVQPDKFETDFGAGYKFLNSKISVTTQTPTSGIERILRWLPEKKPKDSMITIWNTGPLFERIHYYGFRSVNQYWP